jgi:AcrR family transcriptional regulator
MTHMNQSVRREKAPQETTAAPSARRRQARGERRIDLILDVASQVFAEIGFEAATTNAIAARAGISPGSLYQYFPNKDAIGEALANRYRQKLRTTREDAFAPGIVNLPIEAMVDRVVDPIAAFQAENIGFRVLWAGSDVSPRLAAVMDEFHASVVERVASMLAILVPGQPPEIINRRARVCVQIVRAVLALTAESTPDERSALIAELKAVQRAYLRQMLSEGP